MIDDLDTENWVTSMVHLGWRTKNLCWPYYYVSSLEDILFMGFASNGCPWDFNLCYVIKVIRTI